MNNKDLVKQFADWLEKHTGGSQQEHEPSVEITKALDEEERMALFVVLEPQEDEGSTTDLHGDIYTEAEVWKACASYNMHSMKANLFHRIQTEKAKIVQSFVTPSAFVTEDGRQIKKGTWLQWWHFPEGDETSEQLWKMVKSGEINGVSIGCSADFEDV